ncbi:MMPL family transporter [Streptomyces sp. NPDC096040]|uniref:MMPL family transporter n=1 Tax=Streptomyces sp. NPDC096040 TaxID=3155541 RepID=UPI003329CFDE
MPTFLHGLGRFAFRHRRSILAAWLAVVAAALSCMIVFGGSDKLDNSFTIPGSESQQALDRMKTDFPSYSGTSAQVVFTAPKGHKVTDSADHAAIESAVDAARSAPQVIKVISPFQSRTVSADGSTAVAQVLYKVAQSDLDSDALDKLESSAAHAVADRHGMQTHVGGSAFGNAPSQDHTSDIIGVGIALIILTLAFTSLLTAGIPIATALLGVATTTFGMLSLTGVFSISSTAQSLALMIGLAVGIDYALFIVSRHRHQLAHDMDPEESAALAVGTAGSAVVFAGVTVIIAMVGLTVVGIPYLSTMGLCAAGAVLVAVLIATTLLPAILGFAGTRLIPKPGSRAARREHAVGGTVEPAEAGAAEHAAKHSKHSKPSAAEGKAVNMAERWFRLVTRQPLLTLVAVVAALGALAWPAHDMRLALPDNGTAASTAPQRIAYDQISDKLGPGLNGPLLVLADTKNSSDPATAVKKIAYSIDNLSDVAAVGKPMTNKATQTALIQVIPKSAPSAKTTETLVNDIRDNRAKLESETGATYQVSGSTAVGIDVASKLNAALLPFGAVVIGLSLLLLLLVFRSLVVPFKAAIGFVFSMAATLGTVVTVFQQGHLLSMVGLDATGPVSSFLPIILLAVLFGLAMDYEVFLVSRMRENYVHARNPLGAVLSGGRYSGRVVTAAALIMISVFAAFISSDSTMLKQIAFALAAGVLLDAFFIRMTFVPAVLALTRHTAWWIPKWLDRRLPNLDIEGERLQHAHDTRHPAPGPQPESHDETPATPAGNSAGI